MVGGGCGRLGRVWSGGSALLAVGAGLVLGVLCWRLAPVRCVVFVGGRLRGSAGGGWERFELGERGRELARPWPVVLEA
jgi:hypothetical protein